MSSTHAGHSRAQKIDSATQGLKNFLICSEICFYLYLGGFLFLYWKLRRDGGLKKMIFFVNITMTALGVISSIQSRRSLSETPINISAANLWYKGLIFVSLAMTGVYAYFGCKHIGSTRSRGAESFMGAFTFFLMIPFVIICIWGLCHWGRFSQLRNLVAYQGQVGSRAGSVLDDIEM